MSSNGNGNNFEKYLIPDTVEEITLPSGMKSKLRHPTLNYYLGRGTLPGKLAMMLSGDQPTMEGVTGEDLNSSSMLLLCDVFVEPQFSMTIPPKPNTLSIFRLKVRDVNAVLQWAYEKMKDTLQGGGGGADLETFRAEPGTGGDSGSGSKNVAGATELLVPASATSAS